MAPFYADSSALIKLIRNEPESGTLRKFLEEADLVCELVLTELPRAIRRAAAIDPRLPVGALIERTDELLDVLALYPSTVGCSLPPARSPNRPCVLLTPSMSPVRSTSPHDGFVSYDERQSAAARLAGLRTFAPGT